MSRSNISVVGRVLVWMVGVLMGVWVFAVFDVKASWSAEPWWHLDAGARPTLIPARTKDAEQEIVTGESAFVVAKVEVEGHPVACLTSEAIAKQMESVPSIREEFCAGYSQAEVADDAEQLQGLLNDYYGTSVVKVVGASGGEGRVGSPPGEPMIVSAHERGLAPIKLVVATGSASSQVISEGGSGKVVLQAFNLGDAPTSEPVTLADRLPAGLVAGGMAGVIGELQLPERGEDQSLTCSVSSVTCTFNGVLKPYERLEVVIWVTRTGAAKPGGENVFEVSGGGAPSAASVSTPVGLGEGPAPFGVESFEVLPEEEGGAPTTQAGAHPFQLTTMMRLNETAEVPFQPAQPRNLTVDLPAGFVGNAAAVPKCPYAVFTAPENNFFNPCPADTAVGVASAGVVLFHPPHPVSYFDPVVPVFNLPPVAGEPARFGFVAGGNVTVVLDTHVRAGGDYGVTTTVQNLTESGGTLSSIVTLWGVPGDPVHDTARGSECLLHHQEPGCGPSLSSQTPFLTMPSSCESPFESDLVAQSWVSGTEPLVPFSSSYKGVVDGCNREGFEPRLEVQSSTSAAFSPTELRVHLNLPQQTGEAPGGVSEADVRNTKVTLPAGLQVNPAAAGGLAACSEKEIGYREGTPDGRLIFLEESQAERYAEESHHYACLPASKIGTVRVKTPLLEEELTGAVYQAAQGANPFGSLLAVYVVAEAPKAGVRVRLAGKVQVEPDGQLVSTFPNTPQTPFEDFQLNFFGGGRAPLATTGCGSYQTTSVFESWADGTPVSPLTPPFQVSTGPDGGACSSPGFTPAFSTSTTSNRAGGFSPLVTTITRQDGEQTLGTVSVTTPRGLLGMISKVTPCGEAQANLGACPVASKIGHVRIGVGVGNEPLALPEPGKPEDPVYLTGPYKGAPFGIAIVAPAEAGPFNLDENGRPVVVRGKIEVNPLTGQATISTDPAPTRLQGIPLDVRAVEVVVDKPGFIFNPTSCNPTSVNGTIGSSEGATENVSSRFQAADCANLPFKPSFKVLTHAHHTKRKGAYLQVIVKSSAGQANIGRVHVKLPRFLPSRLETLKHACSEAQFAKNPAGCPTGSYVGTATASTPVLPVPLSGPAIFVSHGGAAFPNLDIILQGDNVTLELIGDTFINKGITTSTFASIPDAPVNQFVLTLPEGPHSALAANGNLCKEKPRMPTTITGQNGAVIEQDTKITVLGCKKASAHGKAHAHHKHHG
jgi:hypothetical protein